MPPALFSQRSVIIIKIIIIIVTICSEVQAAGRARRAQCCRCLVALPGVQCAVALCINTKNSLEALSAGHSASGFWLPGVGAGLWVPLGEEQGFGGRWCCWGLADGLVAAAGRAVLAAGDAELPSHSPLPDCSAVS